MMMSVMCFHSYGITLLWWQTMHTCTAMRLPAYVKQPFQGNKGAIVHSCSIDELFINVSTIIKGKVHRLCEQAL